jgi:hypothetical protein
MDNFTLKDKFQTQDGDNSAAERGRIISCNETLAQYTHKKVDVERRKARISLCPG